jgi:hypothetical protein
MVYLSVRQNVVTLIQLGIEARPWSVSVSGLLRVLDGDTVDREAVAVGHLQSNADSGRRNGRITVISFYPRNFYRCLVLSGRSQRHVVN